jgi:hypothetical protein
MPPLTRGAGGKRYFDHDGAFPFVKDRTKPRNAASMSRAFLASWPISFAYSSQVHLRPPCQNPLSALSSPEDFLAMWPPRIPRSSDSRDTLRVIQIIG